jgi:hypothetical protein
MEWPAMLAPGRQSDVTSIARHERRQIIADDGSSGSAGLRDAPVP